MNLPNYARRKLHTEKNGNIIILRRKTKWCENHFPAPKIPRPFNSVEMKAITGAQNRTGVRKFTCKSHSIRDSCSEAQVVVSTGISLFVARYLPHSNLTVTRRRGVKGNTLEVG